MAKWRKIGEVTYREYKYRLYLSNDNNRFTARVQEMSHPDDRISGFRIEYLRNYHSENFINLIKPIIDRALEDARDPSISPNSR